MYICGGDRIGLLLNSVLTAVGATFDDGQNCLSLDKLSAYQMPVVEDSKQQVYNNLNGMVPMEDPSVFAIPMTEHYNPLREIPNVPTCLIRYLTNSFHLLKCNKVLCI